MAHLDNGKRFLTIVSGVILWFAFAMFVRSVPWIFDGGLKNLMLLAAAFPITWLLILIVIRLISLSRNTIFEAVSIGTMAALFCDGLAFTFFSNLYGATETHVRLGAGFILWGAAVGMLIGWFMQGSSEINIQDEESAINT